jgi:polyribonucleotide nucleotidyltransferase
VNDSETDPEELVEITIEGDFDGADQAKKEIDAIVAERTSSTTIKMPSVSPDHYLFIAARAKDWEEGQDVKVKVPTAADDKSVISVSGEKSLVMDTKAKIEDLCEELQRVIISTPLPVQRQQQAVLRPVVQTIFEESGCVVDFPSSTGNPDQVIIRGPRNNFGRAVELVMQHANRVSIDSLEISRAHKVAPNQLQHAIDVARYLRKSGKLSQLEKQHNVQISVPNGKELTTASKVVVDLSGESEQKVKAARADVIALVNDLVPVRFMRYTIEPLLQKHVQGPKSRNVQALRKQHNVELIFPLPDDMNETVVIVYEGGDTKGVASVLEDVKKALEALVSEAGSIVTEVIDVPAKEHVIVSGKNNTTLNAITGGSEAQVRVLFGEPNPDAITVKGPQKEVSRVAKAVREVIEEAKNEAVANSYKLEFDYPAQFTRQLIGKGGNNISKIREELGVKIDVGEEGKITVQGLQRNAEEAKSRISMLGERLADETTFTLKIPSEFQGQIIGSGGKFVKRLEEKYQVRILFPRNNAEAGEDAGDRPGKNEVTVNGGKKGATAAKNEIMELYEFESEHSHTITFEVLERSVAQIVGKGGSAINDIKDETNTRIDIDKNEVEGGKVKITVTGKKAQCEEAKKAILAIDSEVENTVTKVLKVDPAHHRNLIGAGGSNLRDLVVKAGGPEDPSARARMVRFPKNGDAPNEITLKGPQKVVDKIAKLVEKAVGNADSQHSLIVNVPSDTVKMVIGRGGSKRSELETKYSVTIDIPRAEQDQGEEVPIKVIGAEENVANAGKEILALVKVPDQETVQVPRAVHRAVADGGAFIRQLRSNYKVTVDHAGHTVPKANAPAPQAQSQGSGRIDDASNEAEYAFSIVESSSSEETGEIPWVLKGEKEQIARAKKALANAVQQASKQTCTGYLTVPSAQHRFVIGQGGRNINAIRNETETKIDVPRNEGDEIIVIRGSRQGIERARELIVDAAKKK